MITIKVILGSTRPNRFSEKVAQWMRTALPTKEDVQVEYVDLRDFELPFYDQPMSPSQVKDSNYGNEVARKFASEIEAADGYILIVPEYNHGTSGVLKNALDSVYGEWNKKAVAFVGYGGVGGARAIEQLRETAVELDMAPTRAAVHIMSPWYLLDEKGELKAGALDPYVQSLKTLFTELVWWTETLKVGREKAS